MRKLIIICLYGIKHLGDIHFLKIVSCTLFLKHLGETFRENSIDYFKILKLDI